MADPGARAQEAEKMENEVVKTWFEYRHHRDERIVEWFRWPIHDLEVTVFRAIALDHAAGRT